MRWSSGRRFFIRETKCLIFLKSTDREGIVRDKSNRLYEINDKSVVTGQDSISGAASSGESVQHERSPAPLNYSVSTNINGTGHFIIIVGAYINSSREKRLVICDSHYNSNPSVSASIKTPVIADI